MNGFVFQWLGCLSALLLAFPLAWLLAHARKRRAELINAMGGGLGTHRRLRDYLRIAAFILLVAALARPGYSPEKLSVSRSGRDVVFALDVSQSMLAEDVSPSRLEVSKQAVRDALNAFQSERVGLVVYAGSATILCPLTYDYDFVRYMLEQTHTRSVDFGGTTVQSAVEKVVDQVFMDNRSGVQDLVIITDGGDHGSQMEKVTSLLDEQGVELLLIGVGDPEKGSPIPIVDEEGIRTLLRSNESTVYTQLDDASLRTLSSQSPNAQYVAVGKNPFDLGQVYAEYVEGKETSSSDGDEGIVVYQEAAIFFILPALILLFLSECWGAKGLQLGQAFILVATLLCLPKTEAADPHAIPQYTEAKSLYTNGEFTEAESLFSEVITLAPSLSIDQNGLAAMELNRGLCFIALSESEGEAEPKIGLSYAQQAQDAFLAAKRYAPNMQRSGIRLESTATWITELQIRIEEAEKQENEMEEQIQGLIEALQALLESQQTLRNEVEGADVKRTRPKPTKDNPRPAPITAPENASAQAPVFTQRESDLKVLSEGILASMQVLDKQMTPPAMDGLPTTDSILDAPLKLMVKVPIAMQRASEHLGSWSTWPAARAEQTTAEKLIEEILNMLGNNSSDESEGDEWDEEGEYDYSEEMDESMMSSMPMEGDFAAGGEMQELPLPNYSAEDILMEEQGNLQFRQQQRAKANEAKVEKDY